MKSPWLSDEVNEFLHQTSAARARLRKRHDYYHRDNILFFQKAIQKTSRVLIVGCEVQELATQLIAAEKHVLDLVVEEASFDPTLKRVADLRQALQATSFDYVLLPYTFHFLENIQDFLETLRAGLGPQARLIALQYNFLWAPIYKTAERVGLKAPMPSLNWLSHQDVENLFELARFEPVQAGTRCLLPFELFGLAPLINSFLGPLPGIRTLSHKSFVVARPTPSATRSKATVSVVVPARNEAGNIPALLERLPLLAERMEVIFIEGHSSDATWEEIQRQMKEHSRRDLFVLSAFQQTGIGKADAVRLGFAKATGDILMILDSDLSVRPEDLPLFYNAITDGVADFVNGSRLVYNMERQAMQILNLFFNKLFGVWLSWMIGQSVKDTLCGTKVLYRKDYLRIQEAFPHWAGLDPFGDFELLLGAAKLNLKIRDLPIAYKQRTYGTTNISRFRHGWQLFKMCVLFWPEFKK